MSDSPVCFRTIAPNAAQSPAMVEHAVNVLGLKKLAVVHDKGDYGKPLAEDAKTYAEKLGAEVVLFEGITPQGMDYSAVVNKIKHSGAEAVLYGGYHPEASKIVGTMRKKKMDTVFISDDGVMDDTFIKVAGKAAEGVFATGPQDNADNPLAQEAQAAHKAMVNADAGAFFEGAYAAASAMLNAIEKSDSTELDVLRKTLQQEKIATPVGEISFNEKGDAIGVKFSMYVVENGKYIVVK